LTGWHPSGSKLVYRPAALWSTRALLPSLLASHHASS
jgi:hypothetical protein